MHRMQSTRQNWRNNVYMYVYKYKCLYYKTNNFWAYTTKQLHDASITYLVNFKIQPTFIKMQLEELGQALFFSINFKFSLVQSSAIVSRASSG